jgi:site-specific recombinase XerD
MFAGYFFADQIQRYRASPHKSRIDHVAQALVDRRYLKEVMAQHLREWLRFTTDCDARGIAVPQTVHAQEVQEYVARRLPRGSASRRRFVRASVRIFLETDAAGAFRRRVGTAVAQAVPAWMEPALQAYTTFLREHRGLAARTVQKRGWQLARMAAFWDHAGVATLCEIHVSHIQRFLLQVAGQTATRRTYGVTLRSFLRWAYQEGRLPTDLRAAVITGRHMRQAQVRDVLASEDVDRVLAAVDRSRAVGRRDYAVLLLAIRYGMRPSDIRQLRLDDVRWRQRLITIRQAKTGRPLTLPLLPEIADALVAYLRDGRPTTTEREMFVRHRAPFAPFVPTNNLTAIVRPLFRRTGLDQRSGGRGLYVFRHTLASGLLEAGCSIKSIADVLGHQSTDTTMEYATVNLAALRRVALSEAEVCR